MKKLSILFILLILALTAKALYDKYKEGELFPKPEQKEIETKNEEKKGKINKKNKKR